MTDTDRLAHDAAVPAELAALVVFEANRAGVSVRTFRRNNQPKQLLPYRRRVVVAARDAGFDYHSIGRAMNRDHSAMIRAYQREMGRRR